MLIEEFLDDNTTCHHYSNIGMKIRQIETGIIYDDAMDIVPCPYTYEETDEPIDMLDIDLIKDKAKAYDILINDTSR